MVIVLGQSYNISLTSDLETTATWYLDNRNIFWLKYWSKYSPSHEDIRILPAEFHHWRRQQRGTCFHASHRSEYLQHLKEEYASFTLTSAYNSSNLPEISIPLGKFVMFSQPILLTYCPSSVNTTTLWPWQLNRIRNRTLHS